MNGLIVSMATAVCVLFFGFEVSAQCMKVKEIKNVKYYEGKDADEKKHKLNLILPVTDEKFPLVMWIHSGGWSMGDRSGETELCRRFAERGIGCAAISHRLSPDAWGGGSKTKGVKHLEHIKDCARAFAFLYENAKKYGYSREQLFVSGHSSGGHLAALLAADSRYLKELKVPINAIKGAIPIGGAYDMVKYHKDLKANNKYKKTADAHLNQVFGKDEKSWIEASPAAYIKDFKVPMLVIAESETKKFMEDFKKSVENEKIDIIEFMLADRSHYDITGTMSQKGKDEVRDKIIKFIKKHCKNN